MTSRTALSRRRALTAVALVPVGVAGCDAGPPRSDRPSSPTAPEPDADVELVGSVVARIAAAEAVVVAAGRATPRLARVYDPLAAAHAAHRELLSQASPEVREPTAPDGGVPADPTAALEAVRRVERRLRGEVGRACIEASSGDLARVLAVIAGSLAQHAAALDDAASAAARLGAAR